MAVDTAHCFSAFAVAGIVLFDKHFSVSYDVNALLRVLFPIFKLSAVPSAEVVHRCIGIYTVADGYRVDILGHRHEIRAKMRVIVGIPRVAQCTRCVASVQANLVPKS